jgi:hypothetical protein
MQANHGLLSRYLVFLAKYRLQLLYSLLEFNENGLFDTASRRYGAISIGLRNSLSLREIRIHFHRD